MSENLKQTISAVCKQFGNDRSRMMDIVSATQAKLGCVSSEAMDLIAETVSSHRVEVESVVSFYSFLSDRPKGQVVVRLCNDIIDELAGSEKVEGAICEALGIQVGETTEDGKFSLEHTPCVGMCDQAPAVVFNEVVVTKLTAGRARDCIAELKKHGDPHKLVKEFGDGNNAHDLVHAMVRNNIRERGEVIFGEMEEGNGIRHAIAMSPKEAIRAVKTARLRGRGGAGFPAGMKWEFTRGAPGDEKVVICNADEGEPGTFKDRVILTECPDLLFEGMAVAGYAIGAAEGIVYLRGEYTYLRAFLESKLRERRDKGLLGNDICGKKGFNFDIRIQMGAGAYICGEETALISSCEGLRGDPKNRPPFPAAKGYKQRPTSVNNVETLCCAARIFDKGAGWFNEIGNEHSAGTKLLSVSGDCKRPGVYEIPFGITVQDLLSKVGADDTAAVQIGGPSGKMIGSKDFGRSICFEDLPTGGSIMVFNSSRNLLKIASSFMEFFCEETCGYCTPCRVGNTLMKRSLDRIIEGKAEAGEIDYLNHLAVTVKTMSRCGLGQTSPNPVLSTLENFREAYGALVKSDAGGKKLTFDLKSEVSQAESIAKRKSVHV